MLDQANLERERNVSAVRILVLAALTMALIGLGACKTTEGAGKDLENLGENIQDSAD